MLPTLKELAIEKGVSRIDPLTGAFNRRYLDEILEYEIVRLSRTNKFFTLIYFDLDGFKKVNDSKGHHVGDQILCATVFCIKNKSRKTDIISLVGGDEFIIVLFDINEDSVNSAVEKLRNEMSLNNWPITFSMGAVSCYSSSISSDDLIKKADGLMYSVKKNGKNNIAYNIIKN